MRPRVTFPLNKHGKLKLIPCVCGDPHPQECMNAVVCPSCGRETTTSFRLIKQKKFSPRYAWNVRMRDLLWKHNRALFAEVFNLPGKGKQ